ncbi:hypothetical protein BDR07DRAFT_1399266 [Suillus spraguei]|nr:hypothetical protein BDR07DRAFT_1399266 [Suillus spraguei]
MVTAILLFSQLTMLIPYGGAMMIRPSPPPTDGQTYIRLEQRKILQQRFPRAGYCSESAVCQ